LPAETDLDLISTLERLRARHGRAPSYQRLWGAAASGRVPAWREGRGWRVRAADLPALATHFGLTPASDAG
jgi:hypothetical protein